MSARPLPAAASVAAALLLAASSVVAQDGGKRYAVLVGVNEYDHAKLAPLRFAENDVTALADVLTAGGYEVTLLTGAAAKGDPKAAPTRANVAARLTAVLDRCKRADTVVVALAGHGLQFDGRDDAFFCPQDARPFADRADTLVSLAGVYKQLDESGAGVKLLLVDACRDDPTAGRGASRGVDANNSPRPPSGVAALFSCSAGERAFEHDRYKHGVFFHHVLEALRGKHPQALNRRGEVTWDLLQACVRDAVAEDVPGLVGGGAKQTPSLNAGELSGKPPVLLAIPGASTAVATRPATPVTPGVTARSGSKGGAAAESVGRGKVFLYDASGIRNYAMAAERFKVAADAGDADGQFYTGYLIMTGLAYPISDKTANAWLKLAADQGHPLAMAYLGSRTLTGQGVDADEEAGKRLLAAAEPEVRKLADDDDPIALLLYGSYLFNGLVAAKDERRGIELFAKAAGKGFPGGYLALARCFDAGRGVPQNPEKAFQLYLKAAELGHPDAQTMTGACYGMGRGVAADERAAYNWFVKAAAKDESGALYCLAGMFEGGGLVERNMDQALALYRRSAELGNPLAKEKLAKLGVK